MLDRLSAGDSVVVPALWPLEVANALTVLRRRRKLTPDEARTAIEIFRELPAVIDLTKPLLSRSHGLSISRRNTN